MAAPASGIVIKNALTLCLPLNGKAVNSSNILVGKDGKTTIFATALKLPAEGKHHLTVRCADGQCGTSFPVQATEEDPTEEPDDDLAEDTEKKFSSKSDKAAKTGDSAASTLWAAMLTVSGGVLGVLCWSKRREQ